MSSSACPAARATMYAWSPGVPDDRPVAAAVPAGRYDDGAADGDHVVVGVGREVLDLPDLGVPEAGCVDLAGGDHVSRCGGGAGGLFRLRRRGRRDCRD